MSSGFGRVGAALGTMGMSEAGGLRSAADATGNGKKSAPPPPDFMGLAKQADVSNHPNQSNPFGSSTWTQGQDGQWSQNVGFSGPLGDAANGLQSQFASAWANPLDNGAQARQHAEDALYGRATARLDPMWKQREQDTRASLANSGLDPSSEAGAKELDAFGRARNDAYSSALNDSIIGGGNEASRQQALDLQSRMAPLQAMGGLRGLLGMPGAPAGGDYLGAGNLGYNAALQNFNANGGSLGGYGQLMQVLGPLIAAAAKSGA